MKTTIGKILGAIYGFGAYLLFLATFLYAIAFVGDFFVPRTVNSGGPDASVSEALLINAGLLGLFAVQHSLMARPGFKRWLTRVVPKPLERSTYVMATNIVLILLFWQWRPIEGVVWSVESEMAQYVMWGLFGLGWFIVLISTFLISHFDLFGLKQVVRGLKEESAEAPEFQTPGLYKVVRHPIMLGFLIAFWAIPTMTHGHLMFAIATTGYILIGIYFEERDLVDRFGDTYLDYRKTTPALIPWPKGGTE
ncbi:MAG: methanethiol S-methyltransferase [Persicimonas sp.]